jgi:hypothetical protein
MITRSPRPTSNFYLLDKAISEDKRLSWAARGLLIFLLGKPDHWQVSPAALVNETGKSSRRIGRDGVYAILKELKEVGYLHTIGNRNDGGTFAGADYLISESPHTAFPDTVVSPHTALPDTAGPDTANPTQVSIDSKQGLNGKQGLTIPAAPTEPLAAEVALVIPAPDKPETPKPLSAFRLQLAAAKVTREEAKAQKALEAAADRESRKAAQADVRKATWTAFDAAYQTRYGTTLTRNMTTNSLMVSLVERLGADAPHVAAFFLCINDAFVVRNTHHLRLLLSGAESYRTQWATGQAMTATRAQQADKTQSNFDAAQGAKALLRARREQRNAE